MDEKAHDFNTAQHPSTMVDRFGKMPVHNTGLFTIKRLNVPYSKKESPSPPIRLSIHCFIFVLEGETLLSIGDETVLFKENECAVIPAGEIFSVRYYNNCKGYMGGFHTDFFSTDAQQNNILRSFGFLRRWGMSHKVFFEPEKAHFINNLFERIYAENESEKNSDIIKTYLMALLVELNVGYTNTSLSKKHVYIDNELCNKYIELIFENPLHSLSVQHYADKLNVSPTHLHRVIKRFTGKTPMSWLNEAVILEAKGMLLHLDLSINQIAEKLGIHDPSYFSRLFKKQVGMSPHAFRNEMKNTKRG